MPCSWILFTSMNAPSTLCQEVGSNFQVWELLRYQNPKSNKYRKKIKNKKIKKLRQLFSASNWKYNFEINRHVAKLMNLGNQIRLFWIMQTVIKRFSSLGAISGIPESCSIGVICNLRTWAVITSKHMLFKLELGIPLFSHSGLRRLPCQSSMVIGSQVRQYFFFEFMMIRR